MDITRLTRGATKEVRELLRDASRSGCTIRQSASGHYRVTKPCGHSVTVAKTPSDHRALHRIRQDLAR